MHAEGKSGLKQDDVEAARWYTLAAAQKHPEGQCNLGVMYLQGKGVTQDDAKAVELFSSAAEQGNALAQTNLGFMYAQGRGGLPQDDPHAAMWWKRAADQWGGACHREPPDDPRRAPLPARYCRPAGWVEGCQLQRLARSHSGLVAEGNAAVGRVAVLLDGGANPKSFPIDREPASCLVGE
jgi:hypothetical protein